MYLSEETFRKNNVREDTQIDYFCAMHIMFPPCPKYSDALVPIAAEKNINTHFMELLVAVDKDRRVATFENVDTKEKREVEFDFIHVTPQNTAPNFVMESELAAANGWLDVDHYSLQHNKYSNIFGIGDVNNCPTAKTAAAVYSQTPVVVHNMLKAMGHKESEAKYEGYASCPIFVGDGKLMLAEFKYAGVPDESFYSGQTKPSRFWHFVKRHVFPRAYYEYAPQGKWFGRSLFKPQF